MGRILGVVVVIYFVVGFVVLWFTEPDTAEELCRTSKATSIQRSLIIWPATVYFEHFQKPCLGG